MNCPVLSWNACDACGVEEVIGITAPAAQVAPPSLDVNTTSLNVRGAPVQFGSLTLMSSAMSYRIGPLTNGWAPMYWPKLQLPLVTNGTLLAYVRLQVCLPSVECATGRPLTGAPVAKSNVKSSQTS